MTTRYRRLPLPNAGLRTLASSFVEGMVAHLHSKQSSPAKSVLCDWEGEGGSPLATDIATPRR